MTSSTQTLTVPADYIDEMIADRDKARADKDWARADQIRDQLGQLGVVLIDTTDGDTVGIAERPTS